MAVAVQVSAPVQRWDSLILSKDAATPSITKQKPLESHASNVTAFMTFSTTRHVGYMLHLTHRQI